jgi:tape measure domain-containing protein
VSIVAETSKLEAQIKSALDGSGQHADLVGKDIGKRISASASKAMKDGWRPDQDIMAGIPDTKLDRIGARMGQVIGKGVAGGLRAREAGVQFGHSFAQGAGSVGLGGVISRWRQELGGGGAMQAIGFLAGKTLSAGLTAGVGLGAAGIGLALTKGFQRLENIDAATSKLNQMNEVSKRMSKPLIDVQKTVKSVKDSVDGTPYSLDAAFGIAVQAIGAGSKDIGKFMKDVTDAAGFAGDDLGHMGLVLTQVLSKGKADGGDMMQLMEAGLPAKSWIEESYNLTSDQFEKMQAEGKITMDMLQKSIEDHAGGMAKAAGNTLEGSIGNMQTAVARAGADFLSALFGGPGGDPTQGMKEAVNRITEYLKQLDAWINAHREDIKKFFDGAKEAAADVLKVVGNLGDVLKTHPDLIKNVLEAFALWKGIKFTGLLNSLGSVSDALGSKGGIGLLGKLALVTEALNLIDDYNNKKEPGKSQPVNPGAPVGKQAIDIAAGAYIGGKVAGVPGALIGGAAAGMIRPGIDIASAGPGPAINGVLPSAPGQINGQTPTVGGIPIPGLSQNITPTVDTAPALSALGALRDGQKEPIVIPADSDTAPASGTTGAWRTDEAGNPVVIPVDADTSSANASMAAFLDKWSSAIISPKVVVPGQGTLSPSGGPPTLAGLMGVPGKATGGGISGPGSSTSDSIPAMLSNGEHVLTAKDVAKMGGQSGVYRFRNMLQKFDEGGAAVDNFIGPGSGGDIPNAEAERQAAAKKSKLLWPWLYYQSTERGFNTKDDGSLDHAEYGDQGELTKLSASKKMYLLSLKSKKALEYKTKNGLPIGFSGGYQHYATGGAVGKSLLEDMRTKGAIPAGAGSTAEAGTSTLSKGIDIGGEVINGIIDQAASAAATAASAAATVGTAGAGAAAGPGAGAAAAAAIGLGANAAKRGVTYGFDMLGIGADALLQQITPFGMPRWLSTDPSAFMPQQAITGALSNVMGGGAQKAAAQTQGTGVDPNTTQHGTGAGSEPGPGADGPMQTLGKSIYGAFDKAMNPVAETVPPQAAVSNANSFLSTELSAPDAPPPDQPPMFKVDNIYTTDAESVGRELSKRGQLAQMQYTGRPAG